MNALGPVIATAPGVIWPLLIIGPLIGFAVGVAIHRARRTTVTAPPAPQPCWVKGHRYQQVEGGWRCTTCDETVSNAAPAKDGAASRP